MSGPGALGSAPLADRRDDLVGRVPDAALVLAGAASSVGHAGGAVDLGPPEAALDIGENGRLSRISRGRPESATSTGSRERTTVGVRQSPRNRHATDEETKCSSDAAAGKVMLLDERRRHAIERARRHRRSG